MFKFCVRKFKFKFSFDKVAKLKAVKETDVNRIAFLNKVKANSNDNNLKNAVDDINVKYNESMESIIRNQIAE
jgi:hypothetical protein